ncbi:7840_t:CDS:2, partial [Funneliformis mosseae]
HVLTYPGIPGVGILVTLLRNTKKLELADIKKTSFWMLTIFSSEEFLNEWAMCFVLVLNIFKLLKSLQLNLDD